MTNTSAKPLAPFRTRRANWAAFDALPRETKEPCWYCVSGRLTASQPVPQATLVRQLAQLAEAERRACAETYGPDHPQAQVSFSDSEFLE